MKLTQGRIDADCSATRPRTISAQVWDGFTESGGPWDAPAIEAYAVLVVIEDESNVFARGLLPLEPSDDMQSFDIDVSSSILYQDGWMLNVDSIHLSMALIRRSDNKVLHICTNSRATDQDGDEADDDRYILFQSTLSSPLTSLGLGLGEGEFKGWDDQTNVHGVCFEQCRYVAEGGTDLLTSFSHITMLVWDPTVDATPISLQHLLEAWHTSSKWI